MIADYAQPLDESWSRNTIEYQDSGVANTVWSSDINRHALDLQFYSDPNDWVAGSMYNIPVGSSQRTISFWTKRTASGHHVPFAYGGASPGEAVEVFLHSTDKFLVGIVGEYFTTNTIYSNNIWYHVTVTFDSAIDTDLDGFKIYINGVLQATTKVGSSKTVNTASSTEFQFGRSINGANGGRGHVATPLIYNRVLHDVEIKAHANPRFDPFEQRKFIPFGEIAPVVLSDDFDRADAANIGSDWTYTLSIVEILSNYARVDGDNGTTRIAHRFNTSVGSDDHHSSLYLPSAMPANSEIGPMVRRQSSGNNGYYIRLVSGNSISIYRAETSGFDTYLDAVVTTIPSNAKISLQANGSDIQAFVNDVMVLEVTDTTYPTGQYCGFVSQANTGVQFDINDWSASDSLLDDTVLPPTFQPYWVRRNRVIGAGAV